MTKYNIFGLSSFSPELYRSCSLHDERRSRRTKTYLLARFQLKRPVDGRFFPFQTLILKEHYLLSREIVQPHPPKLLPYEYFCHFCCFWNSEQPSFIMLIQRLSPNGQPSRSHLPYRQQNSFKLIHFLRHSWQLTIK